MTSVELKPLMQACQLGNAEDVKTTLADEETDINETDNNGRTALFYCAENLSTNCINLLIDAKVDLDHQDKSNYTCLHLAVIAGNQIIVEYLVNNGANINLQDSDLHTVMHWVVVCGQAHLIDFLLKNDSNAETADIHGAYPIHYAAQMCGNVEIWDETISRDTSKSLVILKKLISAKVDLNVEDADKRNSILWAASSGSSDSVTLLFQAGANPFTHEKDGLTALHCAASKGHADCIKTLIDVCKCSVDMMDNNNCTPIFYGATIGHPDVCQVLIDYGANLYVQDVKGRTVYHCAAARGQLKCLKNILNENSNIWLRNRRGEYPIQEAFLNKHMECVNLFIDKVNRRACNSTNIYDGSSILHLAAADNNLKICKRLVEHGADLNCIMKTSKNEFFTPYDMAAAKNSVVCATYLKTTADRIKKEALFNKKKSKTLTDFKSRRSSEKLGDMRDDSRIENNLPGEPISPEEKLKTSRIKKLENNSRAKTQSKGTKILMTSNRNLNRIDTFYYENPKNKSRTLYSESMNDKDESDEGEEIKKTIVYQSPLIFIKRGRRDKSYFLSNTVQIQCDMSDNEPESEPGETESDTEYESSNDYYEMEKARKKLIAEAEAAALLEANKEKRNPNIIYLTENDALIRLIFQKRTDAKKNSQMTLFEKQRLLLKSLYDIRRSRLNNMDILITKQLDDLLKAYKYDIKQNCRSLKDLERLLEVLALEISNEYKKNQKNSQTPQNVKRSKTLMTTKSKFNSKSKESNLADSSRENSENTRPVIVMSNKKPEKSSLRREKTELKKTCTKAYKPVMPNDLYKKNFSTNTETPLYQQLTYNENTPREKTLILPVIIPKNS